MDNRKSKMLIPPQYVKDSRRSRLAKSVKSLMDQIEYTEGQPEGMFGRVAIVQIGEVKLNSEVLDIEFEVPFDDDTEANEAEITLYNLSKKTRGEIVYNKPVTITAGYQNDTGVIFTGFVSKVVTKVEGVDRITTVYAIDDEDLKERDLPKELEYAENTKASFILNELLSMLKLPVAVFQIRRDWTYEDKVNVSGGLMDNIRKYAEVCGISVYINKGKIYARHISEGDDIQFTVQASTGLLNSPEEFQEEITAEDYHDVVTGFKMKSILQHRITTGAVVTVRSANVSGKFRVRSGKHIFNESESITEMEVI